MSHFPIEPNRVSRKAYYTGRSEARYMRRFSGFYSQCTAPIARWLVVGTDGTVYTYGGSCELYPVLRTGRLPRL